MEKRWVVRRSEPVKEVLLIEGRVYPGRAQGTIGLRIQKRRDIKKYRRTRTRPEIGTIGWELAFRPEEHHGRRLTLSLLRIRPTPYWIVTVTLALWKSVLV